MKFFCMKQRQSFLSKKLIKGMKKKIVWVVLDCKKLIESFPKNAASYCVNDLYLVIVCNPTPAVEKIYIFQRCIWNDSV